MASCLCRKPNSWFPSCSTTTTRQAHSWSDNSTWMAAAGSRNSPVSSQWRIANALLPPLFGKSSFGTAGMGEEKGKDGLPWNDFRIERLCRLWAMHNSVFIYLHCQETWYKNMAATLVLARQFQIGIPNHKLMGYFCISY